jgi:ATP-dependent 26S proteasome regulatory subunit
LNLSHKTSESRLVPHTYAIQQHLAKFEDWVVKLIGNSEDRLHFETTEISHQDFFLPYLQTGLNHKKRSSLITKVETPEGMIPRIKLSAIVHPTPQEVKVDWEGTWRDTPVAIWFDGCERPMIYFHVDFVVGNSTYEMTKSLIVINKAEATKVLNLLSTTFRQVGNQITVIRGEPIALPDDGYKWDRIVLHEDTNKMVREDFESFLESQEWFKENDLPWRRGYLFFGPPGNGKTSAIRVMASHPLVSPFTIDIGGKDVDNSDITDLFTRACKRTPALVILEDIDRMFAKNAQEEERRKVTLQHLLNCLDGIGVSEGVVMVATANEPNQLDPALLKRPGRFDRLVEFKPPAPNQRIEYFKARRSLKLSDEDLLRISESTHGFSFAQLRESFILAGTRAFNSKTDRVITADRLIEGAKEIRKTLKDISRYSTKRGSVNSQAGFSGIVSKTEED